MKMSLTPHPSHGNQQTFPQREDVRPELVRGEDMIAQSQRLFQLCLLWGRDEREPSSWLQSGMDILPGLLRCSWERFPPWSLVHLQTPGPVAIFMPSLHLRADTSRFSVCSAANPLPDVSPQGAKEAAPQHCRLLL